MGAVIKQFDMSIKGLGDLAHDQDFSQNTPYDKTRK